MGRFALAIVLAAGLAAEAAGQSGAAWSGRGESSNARETGEPPETEDAPAAVTGTAGKKGSFAKLVEFFLGVEGETPRSWGFVPLVVADSNAGFGAGIQFNHNDLLGRRGRGEINGLYTSNEFFEGQIRLTGPPVLALDWRALARYRSRPRLFFFGIGNFTRREDRHSLWLEDTTGELRLGLVITPSVFVFGLGEFANVNARDGRHESEAEPPVSSRYDERTLNGFWNRDYTNAAGAALVVDLRDNFLYPTRGARLELRGVYHGPQLGDGWYRYGHYVADAAVYVPIVRSWRTVLAIGARYEAIDASLDRAPFFDIPMLGGTRSLRGFLEGRFRDRNSMLFQAEVRFPIWRVISAAVFVDAGRVYPEFLNPPAPFEHFHYDAGAGVRLVVQPDIFTRLDFAVSREDFTFALEFGNAF